MNTFVPSGPNQPCGECPIWLAAFEMPELQTMDQIIGKCEENECWLLKRNNNER